MRIKNQKDFFSGLLFVIIGICFTWGATNYRIGTSAHMGPGYFPLLCSILLILIGSIICIKALTIDTPDGNPIGRWAFGPIGFITLANMLFGILLSGWPALHIPALGFIAATIVLVLVAARAGPEFRAREVSVLALVLTLGSWLVFVLALNMQMPSWPSFISG